MGDNNSTANGSKLVSNYLIKKIHNCVLSIHTFAKRNIFKSANVIDAANRVQQTVYHGGSNTLAAERRRKKTMKRVVRFDRRTIYVVMKVTAHTRMVQKHMQMPICG